MAAPDALPAEHAQRVLGLEAGPTHVLAEAVGLELLDGRYQFVSRSLAEWLTGRNPQTGIPTAGAFAVQLPQGTHR